MLRLSLALAAGKASKDANCRNLWSGLLLISTRKDVMVYAELKWRCSEGETVIEKLFNLLLVNGLAPSSC